MSDFKSMTDHKELSKQSYDFAIIGSNLHALLIAYTLSRTFHKKVAVLEPSEILGGEDAPVTIGTLKLMSHFERVPKLEPTQELLSWLSKTLDLEMPQEAVEITPLGIDSGKLIPFVGFGDLKFTTLDLLNNFVQSEGFDLHQMPSHWVDLLKDLFIGDIYTMAEVTSLHIENEKLQYAVINGDNKLMADQLVYCLPTKSLKKVVSPEVLSHKHLQKVLKTKTYSRLRWHLIHDEEVTVEEKPYHILFGGKDDFEPVVGQFSEVNNKLHSLWSCWLLSELIDDHEHLGSVLKHIKKQIKRAYPELLDHIEQEKIVFELDNEGSVALSELMMQNLCKVKGLWVCHPQLIENTGLIAKIEAAKLTCDALQQALGLEHREYTLAASENSETELPLNP